MKRPEVSIVVPLYNEVESLPELGPWIARVCEANGLAYEVVFIDDGSSDGSWAAVQKLAADNANMRGISFLRNYGKSAALDTGFQTARGRVVITLDADLQDSPDEIPELYRMVAEDGYDLVSGWKKVRHDPFLKRVTSKFYNRVTGWLSGTNLHDMNCGLKAYKSEVVKAVRVYGEMHRYIPVMAKWTGFKKIGEKVVEHRARKYGKTKFGLERFVNGFLDLLSITFVLRFKKAPMHFFGTLGTLSFVLGFLITCWVVGYKWYLSNVALLPQDRIRDATDQPLFFLALTALVVGVQLFLAGFLAEMMTVNNIANEAYHIKERTDDF